ncbi:MAG: amino acid ABC transporter ATP-binding protein [Pedosphaera sp.]|nr:amino acid ABC transporter ATP-binding protein [Pedosphaera sp.]
MIFVEGVRKKFGAIPVLNGVDHRQSLGEVVVIIGPSGCGKSTFLRCLNQLETADMGRITINNVTVDAGARKEGRDARPQRHRLRLQTGMVFQQFNLFPHLTALENIIEAPMQVAGLSRVEAVTQGMDLLAKVGLSDRANFQPSRLSGGQQQRVAIARALAMRPKVMLFDEPTSSLDPQLREEVLKVIRTLSEEGMTLIIVTHEMNFARDVADSVLFFEGGQVVEFGPPEQVLKNPIHPKTRDFLRSWF